VEGPLSALGGWRSVPAVVQVTETLVIGAGQAGLALSAFLSSAGHEHVVLERGRVGERWRSERWQSLSLLTPNWLNSLPGPAPHAAVNGFLSRDGFIGYLEAYARSFESPVLEGVNVLSVREAAGRGFRVETDVGVWRARRVVIATGHADEPRLPAPASAAPPDLVQLHSSGYRSADQLPPGNVLVVGAGPSGQQIAAELQRAGRQVVLAVGRHAWLPRHYRGADIWYWLQATGALEQTAEQAPQEAAADTPSLVLSGANGGERLDLGVLADLGVQLVGRLGGFRGHEALFADDLEQSVADADQRTRRALAQIDRHIRDHGEDDVCDADPIPAISAPPAPTAINLREATITALIWATGYRRSYPWLRINARTPDGELAHRRGIAHVPGLYALGLRFQHRRRSHFIGGVGEDAQYLAQHILGNSQHTQEPRGSHFAEPSAAAAAQPRADAGQIAPFAQTQLVPSGTVIVKQGDYARDFYVIAQGTAHVRRNGEHLATLGQGEFFGEVGLLQTSWRNADVVAATRLRLHVIQPRDFQVMMAAKQQVAAKVHASAAARA
jgi:putative flavoprotein involved in K+ transport